MRLRNWILLNPFSIIFIILALGIIYGYYCELSLLAASIICALSAMTLVVSMYIRTTKLFISYIYTATFIFSIGLVTSSIHKPKNFLPSGEYINMSIDIDDNISTRGRWQRVYGTLKSYSTNSVDIVSAEQRVEVNIDTSNIVKYGDIIECSGYLNDISQDNGYGRLMAKRGVFRKTYITSNKITSVSNTTNKGIIYYAQTIQQKAFQRLERLNLSENSLAIVAAMSIGDKSHLSPDIKLSYSKSGASHILAVSGLHVGIVFLLINIILSVLPVFIHKGFFFKSLIGVVVIWLFAIVSGLSPSVIRAASMFSIAHIAYATSQTYNSFNIIAATATIMLCINPMWLFDISFQLSFVATASLSLMVSPIYSKLKRSNKYTNKLLSAILTSTVATVGTAPLVAYYFSIIPLFAFIVNIPIILLSYIVVQTALIWIIIPFKWLTLPVFYTLSLSTDSINYIVEFVASLPYSTVSSQPSILQVSLCYILLLVSIVLLKTKEETKIFKKN